MITKTALNKTIRILLVFIFASRLELLISQCANAGNDSLICGFNYTLVGTPSNGHWSYVCDSLSETVSVDSLSQDSLKVKVGVCGSYVFVYHVNSGTCISSDTVVVKFENTSFRSDEVSYKMRIYYPSNTCINGTEDSCGSRRSLIGIIPPKPQWEISMFGKCDLFSAKSTTYGLVDSTCMADSIVLDVNSISRKDTVVWNTIQDAFIQLDSNKEISTNTFNNFINFISQSILEKLELNCPLQKCFNSSNATCTDTIEIDTINIIVPVHKGGRWYLQESNSVNTLNDSTVINVNGKNYLIRFEKGVTYVGPDPVEIDLYSLDNGGNIIPLEESLGLKIVWREEWENDTISFQYVREVEQDRCFCNGVTTEFLLFKMPAAPNLDCDSICLYFSKNPTPKIDGKDLFCSGSFTTLESNKIYKSYKWSNSDNARSTLIYNPGKVYLTVTDELGCEGVDSITIKSSTLPNILIQTNKVAICRGECVSLVAITDTSNKVVWNNTDTVRSIITCPVNDETSFVKAINSDGCVKDTSIRINVFNIPNPILEKELRLTCSIKSVILKPIDPDLGINRKFSWSGPGVFNSQKDSLSFSVNVPGIYVFEVRDTFRNCIGTDTILVIQDTANPKASAGPDLLLNCKNPKINLIADSSSIGAGFLITWSGPSITINNRNDINPEVSRPGIYIIRIRNIDNDCESLDTTRVASDFSQPNASPGGDKFLFCDSTFIIIGGLNTTISPDVEILWNGPGIDTANRNIARPSVSVPGTYTLIVVNRISFCSDTAVVIVKAPDTLPEIVLTKNGNLGCNMDSVIISGAKSIGDKLRFTWSGPRGLIGSGFDSIVVNSTGKYFLYIYDSTSHCNDFDSIVIDDTGGRPFVNAGPDRTLTCEVIRVTLNGSVNIPLADAKIEWTGPGIGGNSSVLQPAVDKAGFYVLKITDSRNNCAGVDSLTVIENLVKPDLDLGQDLTINCLNDTINLLAKIDNNRPIFDFRWSGPGVNAGNLRNNPLLITVPGTYSALINTPNPNCVAFDTINIGIDTARPKLSIPDTLWFDCDNRNIFYKVPDASLLDSVEYFDELNRKIVLTNKGFEVNFTREGKHSYIAHYKNGCEIKRVVNIIPYTFISLGNTIVDSTCSDLNTGSAEIIIVGGDAPFYLELDGSKADTVRKFFNLGAGQHKVRVYDRNGPNSNCFVDVFFTVYEKPTLKAFDTTDYNIMFCKDTALDAKVILNTLLKDLTYEWIVDGKVQSPVLPELVINKTGLYQLRFVNIYGCGIDTFNYFATQFVSRADTFIFLPNVFTPNELTNNVFRLVYDTVNIKFEIGTYRMQIYNRWGQVVFETNDPDASWDGTYKDQQSPTDTYWVLVKGVLDVCGARKETIIKRSLNIIR
ncbi:MAG: T9SS type B sorting domain-containing protein [Saprospiraceae bacterium]|nr:T9SS type B sorting domain-containing protein [Saprospiraceae bacterium]